MAMTVEGGGGMQTIDEVAQMTKSHIRPIRFVTETCCRCQRDGWKHQVSYDLRTRAEYTKMMGGKFPMTEIPDLPAGFEPMSVGAGSSIFRSVEEAIEYCRVYKVAGAGFVFNDKPVFVTAKSDADQVTRDWWKRAAATYEPVGDSAAPSLEQPFYETPLPPSTTGIGDSAEPGMPADLQRVDPDDDPRSNGHCLKHGDYNGREMSCPSCRSYAGEALRELADRLPKPRKAKGMTYLGEIDLSPKTRETALDLHMLKRGDIGWHCSCGQGMTFAESEETAKGFFAEHLAKAREAAPGKEKADE